MRTLQLLCPEHSDRAAHLGERAKGAECAFDFGTTQTVIQSETIVFLSPQNRCKLCEYRVSARICLSVDTPVSAVPRLVYLLALCDCLE